MSEEIKKLAPAEVWEHFYALTQIPRPSKHEEKASAYLAEFGKKLGLETHVDSVGNVIIRKPATPGMEKKRGIVLQSHVDMVPQKNADKVHDFEKDPIDAYVDGEVVRARGTTLGADNGIGAAAAMGVLASKTIKHGPIEALFTIDEETGMTGVNALAADALKGDILLNLDSETIGEIYVGCAGGLDGSFEIPYRTESAAKRTTVAITVKGLKGGHSGMDIILGRANSIKLTVRLLAALQAYDVRLVTFQGGNLRNAIPREATATIAVEPSKMDEVVREIATFERTIQKEFELVDPNITVTADPKAPDAPEMLDADSHARVVKSLFVLPNGVIRMSNAMPGLVETSTNLARVQLENGKATAHCLLRSSLDSGKESLSQRMAAAVELAGGSAKFDNGYPGWNPNLNAPILKAAKEVYAKFFNSDPAVMAIHAGLECAIIGGTYPKMEMISFGPTIMSPHSPDERVNIASVKTFWEFLCHLLENSPAA